MAFASHPDIEGSWLIGYEPFGESYLLVIMLDGRTVQFPPSVTKPRINPATLVGRSLDWRRVW